MPADKGETAEPQPTHLLPSGWSSNMVPYSSQAMRHAWSPMPVMRSDTCWGFPSSLSSSMTYTISSSMIAGDSRHDRPMPGGCLLSRAVTINCPADGWLVRQHLLVGVEPAACVVLLQGLKPLVLQYANHTFQAVHDLCKQHLPGTATWSAKLATGEHARRANMPKRCLHSLQVH